MSGKRCFVTIGATAPFNSLIEAVLREDFLRALRDAKFSHLRIQYGKEGKVIFEKFVAGHGKEIRDHLGIALTGFDFNASGLEQEFYAVQGSRSRSSRDPNEGIVISHAGRTSFEHIRIFQNL